jgi:hypothetical protein
VSALGEINSKNRGINNRKKEGVQNNHTFLDDGTGILKCSGGALLASFFNYKLKEKIVYLYCLSVNYNNPSPAVGNDSQNGIHCCRQAAIIYKLTNNIVMNNTIARLNF